MKIQIVGLLACLVVAGCASEVPIPDTHKLTSQKKVKAAHHWDVIATDIAAETKQLLNSESGIGKRAIYVQPPATETPFSKAFNNFLITQLVRHGIQVSEKPEGALTVRYETQVIRHNSDRIAYYPGTFTTLVAGILVGRNVHTWSATQKGFGALALGAGVDTGAGHYTGVSNTELLVTTSMAEQGLYKMRKTDVYYIEDEDGSIYQQLKEWKVVG